MLIGIPGDNTYANYAEANRAFWRLTVLPLILRTAEAMTGWLAEVYPGGKLDFDLDQVAGLSAERGELWARVEAAGFLSDAEKREAVGYDK
jgi:phage portal protein BeeE